MTQQAAAPTAQFADEAQGGDAGETVGADTAAMVDAAPQKRI
ncbi:hypothetical protein [Mesorhizobium sp.]|nr:hypothetical protein [Mesorhizobium sp.]